MQWRMVPIMATLKAPIDSDNVHPQTFFGDWQVLNVKIIDMTALNQLLGLFNFLVQHGIQSRSSWRGCNNTKWWTCTVLYARVLNPQRERPQMEWNEPKKEERVQVPGAVRLYATPFFLHPNRSLRGYSAIHFFTDLFRHHASFSQKNTPLERDARDAPRGEHVNLTRTSKPEMIFKG